jgi:hypothetical protein
VAQNGVLFLYLKKLPKEITCPIGKNSPYLATLIQIHIRTFFSASARFRTTVRVIGGREEVRNLSTSQIHLCMMDVIDLC